MSFKASNVLLAAMLLIVLPAALFAGTLLTQANAEIGRHNELTNSPADRVVVHDGLDKVYPEIQGVVRDAKGNPVTGATVVLREHPFKCHGYTNRKLEPAFAASLAFEPKYDLKILAQTKTDKEGKFQFKDVAVLDFAQYYDSPYPITLMVLHDDFGVQSTSLNFDPKRDIEFSLSKPDSVSFELKSDARPELRENDVRLVGLMSDSQERALTTLGNVKSSSRNMLKSWLANDSSDQLSQRLAKKSGAKFEIANLPPNSVAVFEVATKGHLSETIYVTNIDKSLVERSARRGESQLVHVSPADIRLHNSVDLKVKIVNAKNGNPVSGARVNVQQRGSRNRSDNHYRDLKTDQTGIVEFKGLDPNQSEVMVYVVPPNGSRFFNNYKRHQLTMEKMKQPLKISLESGVQFKGKVVDQDTGEGIPNVRTFFRSSTPIQASKYRASFGQTNKNGEFTINLPSGSDNAKGEVVVTGPIEGYLPAKNKSDESKSEYASVPLDPNGSKTVPTIKLKKKGESKPPGPVSKQFMEIKVVDQKGQSASGVVVRFIGPEKNGGYSTPETKKTNQDGIVQLELSEYGPFYYKKLAIAAIDKSGSRAGALVYDDPENSVADFREYLKQLIAAKKSPEEPAIGLTIKLQPLAKVKGRLVNENDDQPIAGAMVECCQFQFKRDQFAQIYLPRTETNENGEYELQAIAGQKSYLLFTRGPVTGMVANLASEKFLPEPGKTHEVNHRVAIPKSAIR